MDAVADATVKEIWVMKSAQVGWTEILNNVIGFHVDQDPSPILLVQPTLDLAEAWSKDRLAPMIRDTACLAAKIADPRARDSGNTLLHKKFTGGHLTIAGANAPAGLASRPIRVVLFDEVDRYPASAGTEGDPVSLGRKRTATFWNRKILAGSTPSLKGVSRIEEGFDGSDQRYYFVPCTHCHEFQKLVWAQVTFDKEQPLKACYACQHCGVLLTDADKPQMLREGEWRASRPSLGIAGFHISELYSPWTTWGEMADAFLRAKRFPETFQTWINTALGETWEDKGDTVDTAHVEKRSESYTANSLPPGIGLVTVGTDVQDDRLEVFVYGWGRDEEAWRVEQVVLRGDPTQPQIWLEHDEILKRRYRTDDGRELVIEAACVDSGGHCTEAVYKYAVKRKRHRVFAIKGVGGPGKLVWPKRPSRVSKNRSDLWLIGVDTIKDVIYGRLKKVNEPGPGYFHFDAGADKAFYEQLTSEKIVYKTIQGRKVRVWMPKSSGIRQEGLDGTVYAYAAMIARGGSDLLNKRSSKIEPKPDSEPVVQEAAQPEESKPDEGPEVLLAPPTPRRQPRNPFRPRGGWMSRHRR